MLLEGTVFRGNSGNYTVRVRGDEQIYSVKLRGTLKKDLVYSTTTSHARRVIHSRKRRATDPVAVGDRVMFDAELGVIDSVFPRTSELSRTSPTGREQHVIVANLDTLFVVVSAANPYPDLFLLDRFLVIAEHHDLNSEIIVNKMDLVEDLAETNKIFAVYESIGYPIHYTAVKAGVGVLELREALRGKIAAFAGPSGVGKSSLLNALEPGLKLRTGDVGLVTHKGKHTTTTAELIPLAGDTDTWVADTPGLRQVEFWEIETEDLVYCFREFDKHLGGCQFSNCVHEAEPGCSVRMAVEDGSIDARRHQSYVQLRRGG